MRILNDVGDVARDEAADGGRDSKETKFGGIRGIFVQTKQIDVSEVTLDGLWEFILVDQIDDVMQVWFDGGDGLFDKGCKEVVGVCVDACAFVFCCMEYCVANIARKGE